MTATGESRASGSWVRTWMVHVLTVALLAAGPLIPAVLAAPPAAAALPCDPPVTNQVACENTKPGTDSWQVQSPDPSIAGFPTDISVNRGETVNFKIDTVAPSYRVDIYRLGWYGGIGARQVAALSRSTPQTQPACLTDPPTGLIDCGNWAVSLSWQVPADAVSGIYYAALRRNDGNGDNEIAFVVRHDAGTSKILFQTSDSTWQAYNRYGGNSLYYGTGPGPQGSAYKVSYNRPMFDYGDENFIFNAEYPMLRFLEANGYDLSYTTDVDTARRGNLITNHQIFMPVGHDEYWSNEQRNNVEAARAAGVHLAFFTANEVFWKTRWEPSLGSSPTPWRTVVSYKETKHDAKIDPSPQWTGTWRDARFSPPSDGGRPENSLVGNIFTVNGRRDDSLVVPAAHGKMRLWRNTPLANLPAGQSYTFAPGTLGYEWNVVMDNGFTPAGLAQLSRTTVTMNDGNYVLQNEGDEYAPGTQTHALTLYRHQPSGALVFGAGTVQWAWGLDDEHAFANGPPTSDVRMKQATVNLLADMGVQPATLQSGVVAASASTDVTAPTVAITSAPSGAVAQSYTFSGTVSDAGGRVAGVEVSVDGGTRWHPANWTAGSGTWSYTFTPAGSGQIGLRARAVDDSVRLSAPTTQTITINPPQCPCSLWPETTVPGTPAANDSTPLELGVKFRADTNGYIRGVKFYKGPGNTGTHTGSLWSAAGQRLVTGTFTGETSGGWQTLLFPVPVAVTGGTTYVASYFAPVGHYAADLDYFATTERRLEPLTALRSGVDGLNGVYLAGNPGFPSSSYRASNYWVDVVYALDPGPDTRAPEITTTNPIDAAGSVPLGGPVTVTFDEPVARTPLTFTVTGPSGAVPGSVTFAANDTVVSWTPAPPLAAGTSFTASIRAQDPAGNLMPAARTWQFSTGTPRGGSCPCTVWDDFTRPAVEATLDSAAVEVGTKVRFDVRGQVLGVRFFKGAGNGGSHTGSLWSAAGQRLATGTFTGETSHGWQTLTFSSPVNVDPLTTYVVSYYAPQGRYAASGGYFASTGADYQVLHALRDGVDGPNGIYRYGTGGGFPTSTYQAGNYWVDVVFRNGANGDSTPPVMTSRTPAVNATGVPLSGVVTTTFNEPMDLATAQYSVADPGGAKLAGALTLSADQRTVTWTPTAPLTPGTAYTVSARIADVNGNLLATTETWTFTTVATQTCPCSLFSAATVPTEPSVSDPAAYELGVRFTTSANGMITGVRFYKGTGNTGTHTGSLWSVTGQRLATGTFTGETATGWQTLTFADPVPVLAGQTYVGSYTTTVGRYASDSGYFQRTAVSSAPLSAQLTSAQTPNGVYKPGSGFPDATVGGANYWVDVVYAPPLNGDDIPPSVVSRTPVAGATGVGAGTTVSALFNEPVRLPGAVFTLSDVGGAKLNGALALSPDSRTAIFTPSAPLAAGATYTASVRVSDLNGNLMAAPSTWSFTVTTSQTCPCSLFSAATLPTITSADDTGAYELGVRFTSSTNGVITGVRFYKGAGNTGTHTGSLWTAGGQQLATGTFTGETANGWQTLTFTTPVPVTAGQTYVASYTTTTGRYATDAFYFEQGPAISSPLTAPATGGAGPNGVYAVGSGFPTQTFRGGNYWVDVVFTP